MTDIVWSNVTVTLGQLQPWERNPKSISKAHAKRLLASWDKFGQFQTVAIGPGFEVYDGHQRLSVLRAAYGDGYSVAARQSSRELTDSERRELVIAAHVGTTGQFNWDELANWDAAELQEWGLDGEQMQDWKTSIGALTELIEAAKEEPPEDPGAQIDKADELREKWGVESGQLWKLGSHRIICGDCTDRAVVERVMGGEKADICFTDPPYNVNLDYNNEESDNLSENEYLEWCIKWVALCPDAFLVTPGVKHALWWYAIKGTPQWTIAWIKRNGKSQTGFLGPNKWDPILAYNVSKDYGVDTIEINNEYREQKRMGCKHPGAKPPDLWEQILNRFGGNIVYEPFSGSGTTLIACERLGRKCRAVEISPAYVAVAIERWHVMTGQEPELIG